MNIVVCVDSLNEINFGLNLKFDQFFVVCFSVFRVGKKRTGRPLLKSKKTG